MDAVLNSSTKSRNLTAPSTHCGCKIVDHILSNLQPLLVPQSSRACTDGGPPKSTCGTSSDSNNSKHPPLPVNRNATQCVPRGSPTLVHPRRYLVSRVSIGDMSHGVRGYVIYRGLMNVFSCLVLSVSDSKDLKGGIWIRLCRNWSRMMTQMTRHRQFTGDEKRSVWTHHFKIPSFFV
mmetsp:Transcript_41957/g.49002  ORF Transcript_41957/g.49002 Transcript_41957/m.49002 type:complete len:178 (-) Transcript_41957:392-925(-)